MGLTGGGTPEGDIDVFWRFLGRLATIQKKVISQQILETATRASDERTWAQRFWVAQDNPLAIWSLSIASKASSVEAAENTAVRLLMQAPAPHVGDLWLSQAPSEFRENVQAKREA